LRERFGDAAVGYVDTAALFLLVALDLAAPGARIALVQPHSTLVARDAQRVRAELLQGSTLVGVWFAAQPVFDAGVRVWAPVLEHGRSARVSIARRREANFEHAPPVDATASSATWAPLVVDLTGVPCADVCSRGTVGDLATATAGFRDQFYGLVGAVREQRCDDESLTPRLVTSGLIEPLALAWGDLTATFARERFRHPVVDVEALEADVARWVRAQLVPKLVVATQTRVLEVAVDERGDVVPSTPVIAVHAPPDHLWRLAAAMSAPPVTAIALRTAFGAALSTHAVKLSARQVLGLPLPADENAWDHAARLARAAAAVPRADHAARAAALAEYGAAACVAYGVASSDMLDWWLTRALDPPSRRRMVEG
jgi:hypothetical protein